VIIFRSQKGSASKKGLGNIAIENKLFVFITIITFSLSSCNEEYFSDVFQKTLSNICKEID
jgi:hypothetical protein